MRKIIFTLVARALPTRTVDFAIKGLVAVANQLAQAEAAQTAAAAKASNRAHALREQAKFADAEAAELQAGADRARRIADRFVGLTA